MRKLCFVPVLAWACLMAIPPSLASPGSGDLDDVRSLVPLPSLPSASPVDPSDNVLMLVPSSKASDLLGRQEAVPPQLEAIAACESGGNPRAIGGGGAYRGKYQFSPATWQALGGSGDPAAAPEPEQDRRAATLYAQSGAGQWPACAG